MIVVLVTVKQPTGAGDMDLPNASFIKLSSSSSSAASNKGENAYLTKHCLENKRLYFKAMSMNQKLDKKNNDICYLWLLAEGLHRTMMTHRMTENKRCQKASSTHSSLQSYRQDSIYNIMHINHHFQYFYLNVQNLHLAFLLPLCRFSFCVV